MDNQVHRFHNGIQASSEISVIAPTREDFIWAVGSFLAGGWFRADFDERQERDILQDFHAENERAVGFYLAKRLPRTERVLFTDKGCHILRGEDHVFFLYQDIEAADAQLNVTLRTGKRIQLPWTVSRSNEKLGNLLNSLARPSEYGALRLAVQDAAKKYSPPYVQFFSLAIGVACAVIVWNVFKQGLGAVLGGVIGFVVGQVVGHAVEALVVRGMRETSTTSKGTESPNCGKELLLPKNQSTAEPGASEARLPAAGDKAP